jgi:hypothetical protein
VLEKETRAVVVDKAADEHAGRAPVAPT